MKNPFNASIPFCTVCFARLSFSLIASTKFPKIVETVVFISFSLFEIEVFIELNAFTTGAVIFETIEMIMLIIASKPAFIMDFADSKIFLTESNMPFQSPVNTAINKSKMLLTKFRADWM